MRHFLTVLVGISIGVLVGQGLEIASSGGGYAVLGWACIAAVAYVGQDVLK